MRINLLLTFLLLLPLTVQAQDIRLPNGKLGVMHGMSSEQLARISAEIRANPSAYDTLISVGGCAERSLTGREKNRFRAYGHTSRAYTQSYCRDGQQSRAERYYNDRVDAFMRGDIGRKLTDRCGTREEVQQLLHTQMRLPPQMDEEKSICRAYGLAR